MFGGNSVISQGLLDVLAYQGRSSRMKDMDALRAAQIDRISQPSAERENFDSLTPMEVPRGGIDLGLISIHYGSENASRMKIDVFEYDDDSSLADKHVLQSSLLHEPIDVRVDLSYSCTSVFFTLFAFPRVDIETTARFLAGDGSILREHIWLAGDRMDILFDYTGEKPATHFTVTGGPNLFIDNIDLSERVGPPPENMVKNGGFETDDAWRLGGWAILIAGPSSRWLSLSVAPAEDAFAEQSITLPRPGLYLLSFTLTNDGPEVLPRHGYVSVRGAAFEYAFPLFVDASGTWVRNFLFEFSDSEVAEELTLRIVKRMNDEAVAQYWRVDDVQMVEVSTRGGRPRPLRLPLSK
jgi:hypothetical protein